MCPLRYFCPGAGPALGAERRNFFALRHQFRHALDQENIKVPLAWWCDRKVCHSARTSSGGMSWRPAVRISPSVGCKSSAIRVRDFSRLALAGAAGEATNDVSGLSIILGSGRGCPSCPLYCPCPCPLEPVTFSVTDSVTDGRGGLSQGGGARCDSFAARAAAVLSRCRSFIAHASIAFSAITG